MGGLALAAFVFKTYRSLIHKDGQGRQGNMEVKLLHETHQLVG